jgi:hypothetical protein
MSNRSYDLEDFADEWYEVELSEPILHDDGPLFVEKINQIEAWADVHTTDKYLIMLKHVIFKREKDAMLFRLGYQFHG